MVCSCSLGLLCVWGNYWYCEDEVWETSYSFHHYPPSRYWNPREANKFRIHCPHPLSLLSSGVDVIGALNITEDVLQNTYYKRVLRDAAVQIEKGSPLSGVFIANEHLYPILVGEMILVGEETGQISGMLTEIAGFYETEVEQKTKDLSTIIEPILMVVIGAGVGFLRSP